MNSRNRPTRPGKLTATLLGAAVAFTLLPTTHAQAATSFVDVPAGHIFEADITWLADAGITKGCNPPNNTRFCPDDHVTRGQMAAFLKRALPDLPVIYATVHNDDSHTSEFFDEILWLQSTGVSRGCNPPDNTRFCPDDHVTRGQMAAFLKRALGLEAGNASFSDTRGHVFEADIAALADAGITKGCNPPDNTRFCPDQRVTRGQMAAFLKRALSGTASGGGPGGNTGGGDGYPDPPTNPTDPTSLGDYDLGAAKPVSVGVDGNLANYSVTGQAPLTTDGRLVAFTSTASNLVDNDTNNHDDVFVRQVDGWLRSVSVTSGSSPSIGYSWGPALSRNGRWVAFVSNDPRLTNRDDRPEVMLADLNTAQVRVVSKAHNGGQTNRGSGDQFSPNPVGVTAGGETVVFTSTSSDLTAGLSAHLQAKCDGSAQLAVERVYMWHRSTDTVELVTDQCDGNVFNPAISADGSTVAFVADRDVKLAAADQNNLADVYLYDTNSKTFSLASVNSSGGSGGGGGVDAPDWAVQLSNTGRYVVFTADRSLAGSHTVGTADVFVRDRSSGSTVRVAADVAWDSVSISDSGNHVVYTTEVPDPLSPSRAAWLWTRGSGSKKISPAAAYSASPAISGDGTVISFTSTGQKRDVGRAPQLYIVNRSDI